jgi:hypothetical protein
MIEEGSAEIAFRGMSRPIQELHHQRPIEPVISRDNRDISGGGVGTRDRRREIPGKSRQRKADDQNGHTHQDGQQHPADKKAHR